MDPQDSPPLPDQSPDLPSVCVLQHRLFRRLGCVLFRRADGDNTPVMVMTLGDREAVVPLRALQHELDIADDSPDGRMLALVAESLDFVAGLQTGDKLPSEVLDGRASWTPGPGHRAVAAARLRLRLAAWLRPEAAGAVLADGAMVRRLDEDPAMRQHVHEAVVAASRALGLADPADVLGLIEAVAEELGYIEALREDLLMRVRTLVASVERIGRSGRVNERRAETLTQVRRLSAAALARIAARFDQVDACTDPVMEALRNADSQRSFIRSSRDWLYRLSRAWDPVLVDWDGVASLPQDALWHLIGRTYAFLAPRYMPVQEWQAYANGLRRPKRAPPPAMMTW